MFETGGIGRTPSLLECYLVLIYFGYCNISYQLIYLVIIFTQTIYY